MFVLNRFWPAGFAFFAAGALGPPAAADNPSMSLTSFADAMVIGLMEDGDCWTFRDGLSSRPAVGDCDPRSWVRLFIGGSGFHESHENQYFEVKID
jgi:hypothetical protein